MCRVSAATTLRRIIQCCAATLSSAAIRASSSSTSRNLATDAKAETNSAAASLASSPRMAARISPCAVAVGVPSTLKSGSCTGSREGRSGLQVLCMINAIAARSPAIAYLTKTSRTRSRSTPRRSRQSARRSGDPAGRPAGFPDRPLVNRLPVFLGTVICMEPVLKWVRTVTASAE